MGMEELEELEGRAGNVAAPRQRVLAVLALVQSKELLLVLRRSIEGWPGNLARHRGENASLLLA